MTEEFKKIAAVIEAGRRFLVAAHINPDGDAIGSSLALALSLEKMGKEVVVYNRDAVPFQFTGMPSAERIVRTLEGEASFDAAFVLDCSELERVGSGFSDMVNTDTWVNIDHHLTNKTFADHSVIDSSACSAGYLVYQLVKLLGIEIDLDIAENIYTTILFDTGSFHYSNAGSEAFSAAGDMVALGVSPWDVANKVFENQPQGRIQLLSHVLNTLKVERGGKIASVLVTQEMMKETATGPDATDGFVNYPRSIEGVEVAFLIRETGKDEYKISYRSKGSVNVAEAAQTFGGGGHRNAAGCVIKGDITSVSSRAVEAVKTVMEKA